MNEGPPGPDGTKQRQWLWTTKKAAEASGERVTALTSRERLAAVLEGRIPDHVPVSPDTSNMIPAARTGKPFWDIYLYRDPPIWLAYLDCVKYFGFDSLMDGYANVEFSDLPVNPHGQGIKEAIVRRSKDRIVTQSFVDDGPVPRYLDCFHVYYRDNPPTKGLRGRLLELPLQPDDVEAVSGVRQWPREAALLELVQQEMGDHGLVGIRCGTTKLVNTEEEIYAYYDDPKPFLERRDYLLDHYVRKFHRLMGLPCRPDFLCLGSSGTLIHQTPAMYRQLALPIVQEISALAKRAGIPTHIHSCGPETALVEMTAEETDVTVIDPLEIPPMGDCDLRSLKRRFGSKLVLKGNLHTTDVMLRGSVQDVQDAAKRAIDDGADGGGFILSTGDQCGRDTPEENIFALIETAKTYGRY